MNFDRGVAKNTERLGHATHFVAPLSARNIDRGITRRELGHGIGDALQGPNDSRPDVIHHDKRGPHNAGRRDQDHEDLSVGDRVGRSQGRGIALPPSRRHDLRDFPRQPHRQRATRLQRVLGPSDLPQFAPSQIDDAGVRPAELNERRRRLTQWAVGFQTRRLAKNLVDRTGRSDESLSQGEKQCLIQFAGRFVQDSGDQLALGT